MVHKSEVANKEKAELYATCTTQPLAFCPVVLVEFLSISYILVDRQTFAANLVWASHTQK